MCHLQRQVIALKARTHHNSLIIHVRVRETIFDSLAATGNRKVVVKGMACTTEYLILPIVSSNIIVLCDIGIRAEEVGILIHLAAKHGKFILPTCIIAGTENIQLLGNLLNSIIGIIAYIHLAFLSGFGCNQNYTIGTTTTINSR